MVYVLNDPPANQAPTCSIASPANGATFTAPASVTINASAADSDGTIAKIEFFQGATKLGEDLTSAYSHTWSNVAAGTYSLTAKATDNSNAGTTSAAVSISEPRGRGAGDHGTAGKRDGDGWTDGDVQRDGDGDRAAELSMAEERGEHFRRDVGFLYDAGDGDGRKWRVVQRGGE